MYTVPLVLMTLSAALAAPASFSDQQDFTAFVDSNNLEDEVIVPQKRAALVLDRLLIALQKALNEGGGASRYEVDRDGPRIAPLRVAGMEANDMGKALATLVGQVPPLCQVKHRGGDQLILVFTPPTADEEQRYSKEPIKFKYDTNMGCDEILHHGERFVGGSKGRLVGAVLVKSIHDPAGPPRNKYRLLSVRVCSDVDKAPTAAVCCDVILMLSHASNNYATDANIVNEFRFK